jgi:hypothetical protein
MATRRYGISIGDGEFDVVEDAGSTMAAEKIELTVELATTAVNVGATTRGILKQEVVDAIDKLKNHIIKGNWPPA